MGTNPHPESVRVRPARSSDADTISDFNIRLALESEDIRLDPPTIAAGVRAALGDTAKALYFVAESAARLVGQLMITREWSDWRNGDIWWVQSVYVEPAFRRRGVFRLLYEHAREQAKAAGAVGMRLYVAQHNDAARSTYQRLGMEEAGYLVLEKMFRDDT